jgi:hypothetical protein
LRKLDSYKNKEVVVMAGGFAYRGVLKEVTEDAINLKCMTGWVEIPMDKITSVREKGEKVGMRDNQFVDKSFFEFPPEEENGDKK